ncbi:MAG: flagella basal body P-ring formation protein FlgA [Deltaproteobacteria bacterium]|nr:flagella basal body P-ring formation protein FlgA [Deltaproteobacteria bacterium]
MRAAPFLLVFLLSIAAHADAPVTVDAARLRVGDVVHGAPVAAAAVDLGPAPPPGGTRLLGRSEILDALRRAGVESNRLSIPASVRITGASRVLEPADVSAAVTPMIAKDLPKGVTLVRVDASSRVVVSPRSTLRTVKLAPIPRHKGSALIAAGMEWVCDDRVVATGHVNVALDVSAEAAAPDVLKGAALVVVAGRNRVQVSAPGVSLADGMIGDVVRASIRSTGRIVQVRLTSKDRAAVVEQR